MLQHLLHLSLRRECVRFKPRRHNTHGSSTWNAPTQPVRWVFDTEHSMGHWVLLILFPFVLSGPVSVHGPQIDENECTCEFSIFFELKPTSKVCNILANMWSQANSSRPENKTDIAIEKFCRELPKPLDTQVVLSFSLNFQAQCLQCTSYTQQNGLGILKLLRSSWSPEKICFRVGKCHSQLSSEPPPATVQNGHMFVHYSIL